MLSPNQFLNVTGQCRFAHGGIDLSGVFGLACGYGREQIIDSGFYRIC